MRKDFPGRNPAGSNAMTASRKCSTICSVACAVAVLQLGACAIAPPPDNPWKTPNRPYSPYSPDQYEIMDALMRPCVEHAQATFPEAAQRFNEGLPPGANFVAVAGLPDPHVYADGIYVRIFGATDTRVFGHISDDRYDQNGDKYDFPVDRLGDWLIQYPDRPEEGNWRGKYALLRQDGLVSGPCDPKHPEFAHFRLFRKTYSFVPPVGHSWQLRGAHVTSDGSAFVDMWMQERGGGPYELNTLSVETIGNKNEFATDQDLVDLIVEMEASGYVKTERHTPLEQSVSAYKGLDARCALSHRSAQDNLALLSASGERGPMIREIMELGCVHPASSKIYINMTYSHRYKPGYRDPEFETKAHAVFRSLGFSRFEFDGDYTSIR